MMKKKRKHLSECYLQMAKDLGWTEKAYCTCHDWSPEI